MSDFYARKPGSWRWELESTLLFMMTSFLKSRTDTGLPSNTEFYDEDVNVYLAGLLAAYVDPDFMETAGRYVSPFDIDVAQMARRADPRARYTIYKANADHLMVTAGIFEPPSALLADAEEPRPETRAPVGRGRAYYQMAASYARGLARKETAAIEVLGKLAKGFPQYVHVLNHLRSEYFNLIEQMGVADLARLRDDMDHEARKIEHEERVNRLLDLYSAWLEAPDPALRQRMARLVAEIRAVDPGFRFELPEP